LSTTVLGSLTPGKIEQAVVDLVLEEDEEYLFEVVGKNTIFLTGNYIDQVPPDNVPYNDEDDSDDDMDEDAYDLREVSSDVEINPDALELDSDSDDAHRFEEIDDKEASASLKRPRESDATETETLSKSAQKKLNKKLKAEGGKAVAAGSGGEENKSKKEKKDKKEKKEKSKNGVESGEKEKDAGAVKTLEGGIKVKEGKAGTGKQAKKGNTVSMRYIGKLTDGKIFDQNTSGKPLTFRIGSGDVIKGWDIGIAGMQVGGERQLTIPPAMAYGNKKVKDIPSGSTLVFDVKLLGIK